MIFPTAHIAELARGVWNLLRAVIRLLDRDVMDTEIEQIVGTR
jgi:hypothetical protein